MEQPESTYVAFTEKQIGETGSTDRRHGSGRPMCERNEENETTDRC